jgi:hypothetical protein
MKFHFEKILLSTIVLFISNCASIKAPPGGPIDETPPSIVDIQPTSGTINLIDRKILVKFSEYMDENSFKNNISIFPKLEEGINYKFKGDEIILNLPQNLDSSKTYIIQLNRNIKDEHGVPLAAPIQLAYSSGSKISNGVIEGTVYGEDQKTIHLWKLNESENDSIFATSPDYKTDSDDNGHFSFGYLSSGKYKILAVDKSNSGLPLNTVRSAYGLHWKDSILLTEDDTVSNINMRMWKKPQELKLISGEWSNYNWGKLTFNNELPDSYDLSMNLKHDSNSIDYNYYIDALDKKNLIVQVKDSLTAEQVIVQIDSIIFESKVQLDSSTVNIQISQEADTSFLQLLSPQKVLTIIPNHIDGDDINLIFSKPVELLNDSILMPKLFFKDSIKIDISIKQKTPIHFVLNPNQNWEQNTIYKLEINRDGVNTKYGRGLKDSVQTISISIMKSMGFGGVVGKVVNLLNYNIVVELFSTKNPSLSRIADVNLESQFEFKTVPEGNYSLLFFEDSHKNMKYNFGEVYPPQSSEWFYMYPDTFEVRANWDTELNPIKLPEIK